MNPIIRHLTSLVLLPRHKYYTRTIVLLYRFTGDITASRRRHVNVTASRQRHGVTSTSRRHGDVTAKPHFSSKSLYAVQVNHLNTCRLVLFPVSKKERECVCVCVRERECVCVRERECVCMCVCVRERESVCVCV